MSARSKHPAAHQDEPARAVAWAISNGVRIVWFRVFTMFGSELDWWGPYQNPDEAAAAMQDGEQLVCFEAHWRPGPS